MTYTHRHHGPHLIITLSGKLYDQTHAADLIELAQEHISSFEGNVILDVASLEHINSSGLNLLLKMLNTYKSAQRSVIIAGANHIVKGVLTITKLHTIFELTDNLEDAIQLKRTNKIQH